MSNSLEKLAKTKFDFNAAKATLLERVDAHITFTYNGGLFKATPGFIAGIQAFQPRAAGETLVMLDEYKNPIEVDLIQLKQLAIEWNQYAMNAYLAEYTKLKKVRNGGQL